MGLIDQLLSAVSNPQQQASSGQLSNLANLVQQAGGQQQAQPAATQAVLSIVGQYVRSELQQKQASQGSGEAQSFVNQYSGSTPNPQAVASLFSSQQQNQIVQDTAQRTGLNSSTIQAMLPVLIPVILQLLQSGSNTGQGGNPLLNAFLGTNGDGQMDFGDLIGLAGRLQR